MFCSSKDQYFGVSMRWFCKVGPVFESEHALFLNIRNNFRRWTCSFAPKWLQCSELSMFFLFSQSKISVRGEACSIAAKHDQFLGVSMFCSWISFRKWACSVSENYVRRWVCTVPKKVGSVRRSACSVPVEKDQSWACSVSAKLWSVRWLPCYS